MTTYVSKDAPKLTFFGRDGQKYQFEDGILEIDDDATEAMIDEMVADRAEGLSRYMVKVDRAKAEAAAIAFRENLQAQAISGGTTSESSTETLARMRMEERDKQLKDAGTTPSNLSTDELVLTEKVTPGADDLAPIDQTPAVQDSQSHASEQQAPAGVQMESFFPGKE